MNYNANTGMRHGTVRKPKRVSDVNAVGSSIPTPMQNPYIPYDPYTAGVNTGASSEFIPNVPNQPSFDYNQQYGAQPAYPNSQPQVPISNQNAFSVLSQPMVQNMAFQYSQQLADTGRTVVKEEIEKYVPVSRLKYYFAVDTKYVMSKLRLLFFPFTHKDWSVKYEQDNPVQPRFEINAPDLYIPIMGYVTYVVIAGLVLGMQDRFNPEQIGIYASSSLAWSTVEIAVYMATLYITNIETTLKMLDLLAYSGYKYVGIIFSILVSIVFGRLGYYVSLVYCNLVLGFFLVRSLKAQVLPERQNDHTQHYGTPAIGSKRRMYFLLFVAGTQPVLSWWLSSSLILSAVPKSTV